MKFEEVEQLLKENGAHFEGGVSAARVRHAEQRLGVTFPESLSLYLRRMGRLKVGQFELFGLGDRTPAHLSLVEINLIERAESGSPLRPDLIALENDGAGNLLCMTTLGAAPGQIVFWDHEMGPLQQPDLWATSFEAWICELIEDIAH